MEDSFLTLLTNVLSDEEAVFSISGGSDSVGYPMWIVSIKGAKTDVTYHAYEQKEISRFAIDAMAEYLQSKPKK